LHGHKNPAKPRVNRGAGFVSGFAPWLAWRFSIDRFDLDVNLNNLTAATLIRVSVLFAVLSPVLHPV